MAVTRINNNQISDSVAGNVYLGIDASTKVQDHTITATKLANDLTYGSNFTVSGNLTINGQTTTIDTVSTVIEDPLLVLAYNQTGTPVVDIGYVGIRGTENNIAFAWDESANEFVTAFTLDSGSNSTINISSYANFHTANAVVAGNLSVSGTTSLTGNIVSNLNVIGNVSSNFFIGNGSLLTGITGGNASPGGSNTQIQFNDDGAFAGSAAFTFDDTSNAVAISGNVAAGNVVTSGTVAAAGNVTGLGAVFSGNVTAANFIGNIGGNIAAAGSNTQIQFNDNGLLGGSAAFIFNGTSNTVSVSGNVAAGNVSATGNVSGTGAVFSGNVTAANFIGNVAGNIAAAGSNTQIQFNDNGLLGGSAAFTFNGTSNTVSVSGNIVAGNISTSGSSGDITGANLISAVTFQGNLAATTVVATGNVTGGNIVTGGTVTATGNVSVGNLLTVGQVSATGNVTGNYFIGNGALLTGIDATLIESGTSNIKISEPNGNATVNITGTSNVVVFTAAGMNVTGAVAATGNVTGGNLIASTLVQGATVSASGNLIGGNVVTVGVVQGGSLAVSGDALIAGNLIVGGNVAYVNVENLSIEDSIIRLGTGANGSVLTVNDGKDRGTDLVYYSNVNSQQQSAFMGWDNSTGNMLMASNVVIAGEIVTVIDYGTFEAGTAYLQSANIVGNVNAGNISTAGSLSVASISASGNVVGGNLVTSGVVAATGNVSGGNVVTTGSVESSTVTATGNVVAGNVNTTGSVTATTVSATGNVSGGNLVTSGVVAATGNVSGGNVIATGSVESATVTATGNVVANNVSATGNVTGAGAVFSGNITAANFIGNIGGNIAAAGSNTQIQFNDDGVLGGSAAFTFDSTSNTVAVAGNLSVSGTTSLTGNIVSNLNVIGNVSSNFFIGNGSLLTGIVGGNASPGGSNTQIQFNDDGVFAGSAAFTFDDTSNTVAVAGNLSVSGTTSLTGNIVSDLNVIGNVSSNFFIGNGSLLTGVVGGNASPGGSNTQIQFNDNGAFAGSAAFTFNNSSNAISMSGNVVAGNISTVGTAVAGNIVISANGITSTGGIVNINSAAGDVDFAVNGTTANLLYVDAGANSVSVGNATQITNSVFTMNATSSFVIPRGNTVQRPATGVVGMLRYNTLLDTVEVYTLANGWEDVGNTEFTLITADDFVGDDVATVFTLSEPATTASVIVSINGVVQIPVTAYSVSGTTLTFTEAPTIGDNIDVRILTSTTTITAISNGLGTAIVEPDSTLAQVNITGDLLPSANVTYNLGSNALAWNDLYLSGNTIYLGSLQLRQSDFNTFAVFQNDGTTPAVIAGAGGGGAVTNFVINGAMDVAQRGGDQPGSEVLGQAGLRTTQPDQFLLLNSSATANLAATTAAEFFVNQSTVGANTTVPFAYALDCNVQTELTTVASDDIVAILQRIEGQNVRGLVGQDMTLQFWVQSPVTGTHCVAFRNVGRDRSYIGTYTVDSADTWESKSITVTGGLITSGTWNWETGRGLEIAWVLAAGNTYHGTAGSWLTSNSYSTSAQVNVVGTASDHFLITGVQLALGSTAGNFSYEPVAQTLIKCKYYYQSLPFETSFYAGDATNYPTWYFGIPGLPMHPDTTLDAYGIDGSFTEVNVDPFTGLNGTLQPIQQYLGVRVQLAVTPTAADVYTRFNYAPQLQMIFSGY